MALFLMWMASFFIGAIFWKFLDLGWSTWKDENFLQVQSKHCKRLCNVIPSLEKCLKNMKASSKTKVLNKNQCVHIFGKLIQVMKAIDKLLSITTEDLKFQLIFEELCCLQRKVEIVGKNCTKHKQWCHLVVFQLQIKETFRELLLDLKCCYDTTCDIYLVCHPSQSNNILPIQFDAATYEQILEDGEVVKERLQLVLQGEVSEDYEIAKHLLLRLRNLDRVDGGDLDTLEISYDFKAPKLIKEIGVGNYGHVYKSNWLGIVCATKVLEGDSEYLMSSQKEPGILAGLSHPNLVQFLGCGLNKKIDENSKDDGIGEMHLVVELMESSLSTILKKAKQPLSYHFAIDIMHQIAKGVYYLHDMQVAHLDLKPDNVLSSSILMEDLDPCRIFKVTDYGTSQLEVDSNPEHPKPSKYTIGSLGYMAPEMIKESTTPLYPFQADVWSFAMICSEILSRKIPYIDLKPNEFFDQFSCTHGVNNKSLRPELPNNCKELTNLIQECWVQEPLQRPTFSKICERLASLKKSFLKGTYSYKMVPQFGSSCSLRDSKSISDHVLKVDERIAPPKKIQVDLDHQLSKIKELLKMNYVGIVGMGGIGKTTLAKAIFKDATMNSLYHASCFVAKCKNYQNSYEILCEILLKLENDQKPKNLGDAQKMMKKLLVEKKVLLIFDDIKDESQVRDVVPQDIIEDSKGSSIILTTREWSTIKSFVSIEGRLDVELLDDKASTTLFTTHLSWSEGSLSLDFENLRKHIVKACNGLPLSLKVMGAFLRHKERLRSWERALQRMARGRNLDGDEAIWNTLKISFDGLINEVEKKIFLDVACFFCKDVYPFGISKETILFMWSKDGILPVDELERLIDMSLLKVNNDGEILEMHDQLRDMGRMIVKGTRIWKESMIPESRFLSKDAKVLEGIFWQRTMNHHLPSIKDYQSVDFKNLRVLILVSTLSTSRAHFDNMEVVLLFASQCLQLEAILIGNSNEDGFPCNCSTNTRVFLNKTISDLCGACTSLKILDLIGIPFLDQLPRRFASSTTLKRLNLSFSSSLEALPKEVEKLIALTTLILKHCSSLVALPKEVGNLSSLTTLNLGYCIKLKTLPKEVGNLSSLTSLDLSGCSSLASLPKEVGNLSSLTDLNLGSCSSLTTLPNEVGNLSSLTTLDLRRCSNLAALLKEVGSLSSLTTLDLGYCTNLTTLPKEVGNLSSLTTLDLRGCSNLASLPKKVENLSSLIDLNLGSCSNLTTLPNEVGNLYSLTILDLRRCPKLVVLPNEIGNLSSLRILYLVSCSSLTTLPNEVGNISSLITLNLRKCSNLVALPKEVGNLSSLTTLNLRGCSRLEVLPKEVGNLFSLTTLDLFRCSSLVALPKEVGNLSFLTSLNLGCWSNLVALPKEVENMSSLTAINFFQCSSLIALPKEVGNLSSLTTLNLKQCSNLKTLPNEVKNLSSLTNLDFEDCFSLATLSKEVGNLSSLTILNLRRCLNLTTLPKEIGSLPSLTTLNLRGCSSLATLPKEVGNLTSLIILDLQGCSNLVALPKEVGNMTSLIILDLRGCSNLVALPKEVGNLTCLTTLDLGHCSNLAALPMEVGNLSSLTTLDLRWYPNLKTLPNEVGNIFPLITLNLVNCSSLEALPKEVGNLTSLITLNLEFCKSLATLPKEVGNLTCLTTLDLQGCSILEALPKDVGNLSFLTTLKLKYCIKLADLPKELGNLTTLTTLDLKYCKSLASLPKELGNLTSLTTLNLNGCSSLVSLPKEVENLTSLITLNLGFCKSLATLPKEVGNLTCLTTLDLQGCSILEALPKELGNLTTLTTLNLKDCKSLASLPKEVKNLSSVCND